MEVGFVIIRPDGKLQKTYDATQTAVITEVYRTREDAEFVASLLFDGGWSFRCSWWKQQR
jgi:hypothetical protein